MLVVHQSNRLETLAARLVDLLATPAGDPLAPETVVVQSQGMARWLAMRIADRLGVCANVRFPFPAGFVWDLLRRALPDLPAVAAFDADVLAWHLHALLEAPGDGSTFAPLRDWLGQGGDPTDDRHRFELARRLADTYDQYLVYRPDWILDWEQGGDDDWQAALWRRLVARAGAEHRPALVRRFLDALAAGRVSEAELPPRLALFGLSTLPPMYLDVFGLLAAHTDIHFFFLNPSPEWWGDVQKAKRIVRQAGGGDAEDLHLETGNRLLASMGTEGRDLLWRLQDHPHDDRPSFEAPDETSLLRSLQADVFHLRNRGAPRTAVPRDDRSLRVHVCHSPMREVEVLHDQLLRLFEDHPDLTPADVVVMTPDIDAYAACVEAVFRTAPADRRIPFTIADRRLGAEQPLVETFLALLDLPQSRYEAHRLLALLDVPAVQRRFGLVPADVTGLRTWVREAGVRWGADAAGRAELGLPATGEHTWRFGLDRLLLGYAFRGGGERLIGGILPYDDVEGSEALALGRLAAFVEAATALRAVLAVPRAPADWRDTLLGVLSRFAEPDDGEEPAAHAVREALQRLAAEAEAAGYAAPVSLDLVRTRVRELLEAPGAPGRFLAGRVTFCAMVPMRSIPFQVVCLIGLDGGVFPRADRHLAFDRMAVAPRRGDRSRREDDRQLFLEALLSARRALHLSYVGRDIRDNGVIPPSVLVSELLDSVDAGFTADVVVEHPLQPFSRRYFQSDPERFSYSDAFRKASVALRDGGRPPAPFVTTGLPPPDPAAPVKLDAFVRFFEHPARYLLREQLGIRLEEREGLIEPREPFVLDGLERWSLRQALLACREAGQSPEQALGLVRARGLLPHGGFGAAVVAREQVVVDEFARRVEAVRAQGTFPPLPVALQAGPIRLEGALVGLTRAGLVDFRLAKMRARDRVSLWIRHLVLQLVAPAEVARTSWWFGLEGELTLASVDGAVAHLARLGARFLEGQSQPLPFFPESAGEWLGEQEPTATRKARSRWEGTDDVRGEGEDPYYQLAFRGRDPIDDEFRRLAREILEPVAGAEA